MQRTAQLRGRPTSQSLRRMMSQTRAIALDAAPLSPAAASAAAIRKLPVQGFLQRIKENNQGLEALPALTPFRVAGQALGKLKPE